MQNELSAEKPLFDRRGLLDLLVPLFIEQILSVTISIADTMMVAGCGEASVSAVSLVSQINILLITIFSAMATGGAVVTSQYIGRGEKDNAQLTAKQLFYLCLIISTVIMTVSLILNRQILRGIYGAIEDDVMSACRIYFYITAIDYPLIALYNAAAALFRSVGNSRVSMLVSTLMNAINITGNAILIYGFDMGVTGAALATMFSRIVGTTVILMLILRPNKDIWIEKVLHPVMNRDMIARILKIAVPNGLENSMFQIGKLLLASLITTFGTSAIAANAVCNNISNFAIMPGTAIGLGMVTVVGQCVGASAYDQAIKYTRKLMTMIYIGMITFNFIIFLTTPPLLHLYKLGGEAYALAYHIEKVYVFCSMTIWPLSFSLPNALRASGDARFTMVVSSISMWVFRIGCSYLFALAFDMGLDSVWYAMYIDWIFRSILFIIRFAGGKWKTKAVI